MSTPTYNVFDELFERGLIAQSTNMDKVREILGKEKVTFYIGFDGTADSLHIGHFMTIKIMMHMQRAGHIPIALLGTGTTMVGDPSGRNDERKMLSEEVINYNAEKFKGQISRFLDFSSEDKGIVRRNGDWLKKLNFMDFLRNYGVHFSVNRMLGMESVKSRLEQGLTFFEFSYSLLQSYDFLKLNRNEDCVMQMGGDDQWSNIIAGVELVRKADQKEVFGLTVPLLVKSDGTKMGKSDDGGVVWIEKEKFSPYEFYQYFRNTADADVINYMKFLTFIPMDDIREYEKLEGSDINSAKEILAFELTKLIHGEEEAEKAEKNSKDIFLSGKMEGDMPTTDLTVSDFDEQGNIGILNLLVKIGFGKTNSEARRLLTQGGISVNDKVITEPKTFINFSDIKLKEYIIRKGKKVYHKVVFL